MEATAQMTAVCDGCGARYRVAAEQAGKRLKCKKCGLIVSVPIDTKEHATAHPATMPPRPEPARMPAVAPKPSQAAGSLRERAAQRRPVAKVGPMHFVVIGAAVLVVLLYMMLGR